MTSRSTSRVVSYNEESDASDQDSTDGGKETSASSASGVTVERIFGRKVIQDNSMASSAIVDVGVKEMFYVKWKGYSYLHASWETRQDIEDVDPQAKHKIKRFILTPQAPGIKGEGYFDSESVTDGGEPVYIDPDDVEYFSPEYVEVQRIVSCNTTKTIQRYAKSAKHLIETFDAANDIDNGLGSGVELQYLVKWRGLGYNECSWETYDDIKDLVNNEIYRFWHRQVFPEVDDLPSEDFHPSLASYKRLEKSPIFGTAAAIIRKRALAAKKKRESSSAMAVAGGGSRSKNQEDDNNEDDEELSAEVVPLTLRDYQLEGVNWLLWNWWHRRPSILADEMGLGKTIQSIAFMHQLRFMETTNNRGPYLLVAPLSLISQWHSEFAMWSPEMNVVVLHGSQEAREMIISNEFYYSEPFVSKEDARRLKKANVTKFHVLLTTFEMVQKDLKIISKINWKIMIIDEAHRLKNPNSKLFEALTMVPREHVLLLTGTPLQNKTEELWALLNFADSSRFDDIDEFLEKFGDLKDASQVAKLHDVLKRYLLRRIKEDVEKSLPPKEETIIEVALTSIQKQFYRAIYEKNTAHLFKGAKASNQPSLMNVMMELRKCCNHPFLIRGAEERIMEDVPDLLRNERSTIFRKLVESSGKFVILDKLLPKLYQQGHKVLIFSQMVKVLNFIEEFISYKGYSYERLDGSTKASDRNEGVKRFCDKNDKAGSKFIMLLSTKAGGLGLNLTAADTVIIFDSDWNPQNDLQAQARAHRIGQSKAVMVYRLLTRKTYEMHMFHKASLKLGLDRAVLAQARSELEDDKSSEYNKQMTAQEIDELLKRGAYDVFREDESEQREFVEEDIDSILLRRSHKVTMDNSSNNSKLGSFGKASFVSFDDKEDIDINDPDFWSKAVGLKEGFVPTEEEEHLLMQLQMQPNQRNRKKTIVFGRDDEKNEKNKNKKDKDKKESDKPSEYLTFGNFVRDRLVRALNFYGFGRWNKIRQESGSAQRKLEDIEAFTRSHVIQCGIHTSESELGKQDSDFVRDAVSSAKAVAGKVEIPPSLSEDKYVAKLEAGVAKKTLNRLDILARLSHIIREAVERAFNSLNEQMDPSLDLDGLVATIGIDALKKALPLGDIRPQWTRPEKWWDLDCDRDLIVGTFKLGYGRYDAMRIDPELTIKEKIETYLQTVAAENPDQMAVSSSSSSSSSASSASSSSSSSSSSSTNVDPDVVNESLMDYAVVHKGLTRCSSSDSVDLLMIDTSDNMLGSFNESGANSPRTPMFDTNSNNDIDNRQDGIGLPMDLAVDKNDGENDGENDDGDDANKAASSQSRDKSMPDARTLNRLLIWLISADDARLLVEKNPKRKRQRGSTTAAASTTSSEKTSNAVSVVPRVKARKLENESHCGDAADKLPFLYKMINFDVMSLIYKPDRENGVSKCAAILATKSSLTLNQIYATLSKEPAALNMSGSGGSSGGGESELDALKMSSSYIMYGIPVIDPAKVVSEDVTEEILCHPTKCLEYLSNFTVGSKEESKFTYFNWSKLAELSGSPTISADMSRNFFNKGWLDICTDLSMMDEVDFTASGEDSVVVPNPYKSVAEHNYTAKGLCILFLHRHQMLQVARCFVCDYLDVLVEYLKSPKGCVTEGMPAWYCPWIHDVALILGCLKHGYLNLRPIFSDDTLPFGAPSLSAFVRRVFLFGSASQVPASSSELKTTEDAESWLRVAVHSVPDRNLLELRLFRIFSDLTRNVGNHPFKVSIFVETTEAKYNRFRVIAGSNLSTLKEESDKVAEENNSNKEDVFDNFNFDSNILSIDPSKRKKVPAMSLQNFLGKTSAGRRLALTNPLRASTDDSKEQEMDE